MEILDGRKMLTILTCTCKIFLIFLVVAAIPLIALLVSTPTLLPWESISIPYLPTFHVIATMAPWVGSIMYHMFMSHCSGYPVYKAVLTIDVLGIWTTQTTGTVNGFSDSLTLVKA